MIKLCRTQLIWILIYSLECVVSTNACCSHNSIGTNIKNPQLGLAPHANFGSGNPNACHLICGAATRTYPTRKWYGQRQIYINNKLKTNPAALVSSLKNIRNKNIEKDNGRSTRLATQVLGTDNLQLNKSNVNNQINNIINEKSLTFISCNDIDKEFLQEISSKNSRQREEIYNKIDKPLKFVTINNNLWKLQPSFIRAKIANKYNIQPSQYHNDIRTTLTEKYNYLIKNVRKDTINWKKLIEILLKIPSNDILHRVNNYNRYINAIYNTLILDEIPHLIIEVSDENNRKTIYQEITPDIVNCQTQTFHSMNSVSTTEPKTTYDSYYNIPIGNINIIYGPFIKNEPFKAILNKIYLIILNEFKPNKNNGICLRRLKPLEQNNLKLPIEVPSSRPCYMVPTYGPPELKYSNNLTNDLNETFSTIQELSNNKFNMLYLDKNNGPSFITSYQTNKQVGPYIPINVDMNMIYTPLYGTCQHQLPKPKSPYPCKLEKTTIKYDICDKQDNEERNICAQRRRPQIIFRRPFTTTNNPYAKGFSSTKSSVPIYLPTSAAKPTLIPIKIPYSLPYCCYCYKADLQKYSTDTSKIFQQPDTQSKVYDNLMIKSEINSNLQGGVPKPKKQPLEVLTNSDNLNINNLKNKLKEINHPLHTELENTPNLNNLKLNNILRYIHPILEIPYNFGNILKQSNDFGILNKSYYINYYMPDSYSKSYFFDKSPELSFESQIFPSNKHSGLSLISPIQSNGKRGYYMKWIQKYRPVQFHYANDIETPSIVFPNEYPLDASLCTKSELQKASIYPLTLISSGYNLTKPTMSTSSIKTLIRPNKSTDGLESCYSNQIVQAINREPLQFVPKIPTIYTLQTKQIPKYFKIEKPDAKGDIKHKILFKYPTIPPYSQMFEFPLQQSPIETDLQHNQLPKTVKTIQPLLSLPTFPTKSAFIASRNSQTLAPEKNKSIYDQSQLTFNQIRLVPLESEKYNLNQPVLYDPPILESSMKPKNLQAISELDPKITPKLQPKTNMLANVPRTENLLSLPQIIKPIDQEEIKPTPNLQDNYKKISKQPYNLNSFLKDFRIYKTSQYLPPPTCLNSEPGSHFPPCLDPNLIYPPSTSNKYPIANQLLSGTMPSITTRSIQRQDRPIIYSTSSRNTNQIKRNQRIHETGLVPKIDKKDIFKLPVPHIFSQLSPSILHQKYPQTKYNNGEIILNSNQIQSQTLPLQNTGNPMSSSVPSIQSVAIVHKNPSMNYRTPVQSPSAQNNPRNKIIVTTNETMVCPQVQEEIVKINLQPPRETLDQTKGINEITQPNDLAVKTQKYKDTNCYKPVTMTKELGPIIVDLQQLDKPQAENYMNHALLFKQPTPQPTLLSDSQIIGISLKQAPIKTINNSINPQNVHIIDSIPVKTFTNNPKVHTNKLSTSRPAHPYSPNQNVQKLNTDPLQLASRPLLTVSSQFKIEKPEVNDKILFKHPTLPSDVQCLKTHIETGYNSPNLKELPQLSSTSTFPTQAVIIPSQDKPILIPEKYKNVHKSIFDQSQLPFNQIKLIPLKSEKFNLNQPILFEPSIYESSIEPDNLPAISELVSRITSKLRPETETLVNMPRTENLISLPLTEKSKIQEEIKPKPPSLDKQILKQNLPYNLQSVLKDFGIHKNQQYLSQLTSPNIWTGSHFPPCLDPNLVYPPSTSNKYPIAKKAQLGTIHSITTGSNQRQERPIIYSTDTNQLKTDEPVNKTRLVPNTDEKDICKLPVPKYPVNSSWLSPSLLSKDNPDIKRNNAEAIPYSSQILSQTTPFQIIEKPASSFNPSLQPALPLNSPPFSIPSALKMFGIPLRHSKKETIYNSPNLSKSLKPTQNFLDNVKQTSQQNLPCKPQSISKDLGIYKNPQYLSSLTSLNIGPEKHLLPSLNFNLVYPPCTSQKYSTLNTPSSGKMQPDLTQGPYQKQERPIAYPSSTGDRNQIKISKTNEIDIFKLQDPDTSWLSPSLLSTEYQQTKGEDIIPNSNQIISQALPSHNLYKPKSYLNRLIPVQSPSEYVKPRNKMMIKSLNKEVPEAQKQSTHLEPTIEALNEIKRINEIYQPKFLVPETQKLYDDSNKNTAGPITGEFEPTNLYIQQLGSNPQAPTFLNINNPPVNHLKQEVYKQPVILSDSQNFNVPLGEHPSTSNSPNLLEPSNQKVQEAITPSSLDSQPKQLPKIIEIIQTFEPQFIQKTIKPENDDVNKPTLDTSSILNSSIRPNKLLTTLQSDPKIISKLKPEKDSIVNTPLTKNLHSLALTKNIEGPDKNYREPILLNKKQASKQDSPYTHSTLKDYEINKKPQYFSPLTSLGIGPELPSPPSLHPIFVYPSSIPLKYSIPYADSIRKSYQKQKESIFYSASPRDTNQLKPNEYSDIFRLPQIKSHLKYSLNTSDQRTSSPDSNILNKQLPEQVISSKEIYNPPCFSKSTEHNPEIEEEASMLLNSQVFGIQSPIGAIRKSPFQQSLQDLTPITLSDGQQLTYNRVHSNTPNVFHNLVQETLPKSLQFAASTPSTFGSEPKQLLKTIEKIQPSKSTLHTTAEYEKDIPIYFPKRKYNYDLHKNLLVLGNPIIVQTDNNASPIKTTLMKPDLEHSPCFHVKTVEPENTGNIQTLGNRLNKHKKQEKLLSTPHQHPAFQQIPSPPSPSTSSSQASILSSNFKEYRNSATQIPQFPSETFTPLDSYQVNNLLAIDKSPSAFNSHGYVSERGTLPTISSKTFSIPLQNDKVLEETTSKVAITNSSLQLIPPFEQQRISPIQFLENPHLSLQSNKEFPESLGFNQPLSHEVLKPSSLINENSDKCKALKYNLWPVKCQDTFTPNQYLYSSQPRLALSESSSELYSTPGLATTSSESIAFSAPVTISNNPILDRTFFTQLPLQTKVEQNPYLRPLFNDDVITSSNQDIEFVPSEPSLEPSTLIVDNNKAYQSPKYHRLYEDKIPNYVDHDVPIIGSSHQEDSLHLKSSYISSPPEIVIETRPGSHHETSLQYPYFPQEKCNSNFEDKSVQNKGVDTLSKDYILEENTPNENENYNPSLFEPRVRSPPLKTNSILDAIRQSLSDPESPLNAKICESNTDYKTKEITIPLGELGIAKYEPTNIHEFCLKTDNPDIFLQAWNSKLKVIKPKLIFEVKDYEAINFMPVVKNNYYPPELVQDIAKDVITKLYSEPIVIHGVYSYYKPYAIVDHVNYNFMRNGCAYILWPTFCNCGCMQSGCTCGYQ